MARILTARHSIGFSAAAALLVASAIVAHGADFSAIHGKWMGAGMGCVENNDFRRTISRTKVSTWESTCRVLSSRTQGKTYVLKLECSGEGDTWVDSSTFKLVDRRTLMVDGTRYTRC